ncbi:MAG TPA: hypothetical protein EYO76_05685 [Flavobacteriaceae bacterium]|nr:hypothetical protein [Flavobacteriaceae bacterium]
MKRLFTLLITLGIYSSCYAQNITPQLLGFEAYNIKDSTFGEANYYLSTDSTDTKKPLLVYLDGSGAFPLF